MIIDDFSKILNIPTFVIHLSHKSPERKDFFMNNLKKSKYNDINIFEGVNAYNLLQLKETIALFNNPKIDESLGKGQIGCLLSHIKLYKHIIDNNIQIANIFEDDIYFHPEYNKLAPEYYLNTPKDFDIIFIGNQIYNYKAPKINKESCFCTHAYIITLDGARKIYDLIISFGFNYELNEHLLEEKYNGIFVIDFIFFMSQKMMNKNKSLKLFNWYCWNGLNYQCDDNRLPLKGAKEKNCGLVFQCDNFKSTIA
jgi:GR25 family glycosyltransferase involved in LPS biosynthesis